MQFRPSYVTKYSALFPSPWHTIDSGLPSGGSSGAEYFPNLYPEDIPNYIRRNELFFDGQKWRYKTPRKQVFTLNGEYNFVVQGGQIIYSKAKIWFGKSAPSLRDATRTGKSKVKSHIDIARGNNVDFAGQIPFGHNKNNKGQPLPYGTLRERGSQKSNILNPINKFRGLYLFVSGQIHYWNNVSGHYKPSVNSAVNAGLPLNLFTPDNFLQ